MSTHLQRTGLGKAKLVLNVAEVFLPLLEPVRFKGAKGGRGSGKSHFFAELLVDRCVTQTTRVVCVREIQVSIKDSVKQLIEDKLDQFGLRGMAVVTQQEIFFPLTKSIIIFKGMRNHTAASIKSLEGFDIAWFEEAQTCTKISLDLLIPTIRKALSELWFSWNPVSPSDPIETLFRENADDPNFVSVEANYDHNPWFPDELRTDMERDKRRDPDKYAHVWRGGYQRATQTRVFHNFRVGEAHEFVEKADRYYYGADFGFSIDPTVCVRMYITERTLWIDREAYKVGCEIEHTPALFAGEDPKNPKQWENPYGHPGLPGVLDWPLIADSARPETISHLRRKGFRKIRKSIKGPGSLIEGVEFLKDYDIVIHPDCVHTADEFAFYSFKVDPLTGEVLPILEDKKNHVIDAVRYAIEPLRRGRGGLQ